MLPAASSDSEPPSDGEEEAEWAVNPLFDQGNATPFGTPVQQGHTSGVSVEAAALRGWPTPRRLDFAVAETLRQGQVVQPGAPVPSFGAGTTSVVVSKGTMEEGLLGRLGALGLCGGGSSSSGGATGKWPGDAGMSFCIHKIEVDPKVAEAQAKKRSATQQLGIIASQIRPLSPGARVHDVVVRALAPFITEVLRGHPINVEALVITELEYLRTGNSRVSGTVSMVVPTPPSVSPAAFMLAARAVIVFDQAHADDAAKLAALLALGTASDLLAAVQVFPGHEALKQLLQASLPPPSAVPDAAGAAAAAAAEAAAHALAHGWQLVADDLYAHPQHGVCAVRDMPIIKYWQTMARYCAAMSQAEVQQLKELPMADGDNPVAYATRLSVICQAVRDVHASNPASTDFPEKEEYAVFIKAVLGHKVYGPLYMEHAVSIERLPHAERTPLAVAEQIMLAHEVRQDLVAEQAKLAAIAAAAQQPVSGASLLSPQVVTQREQQQSAASSGSGGYHIQHGGHRHVAHVVQSMPDKVKQSLIRALISQPGYEHLQPLVHAPHVAAAAGLRQHQALQHQRQQIGRAPHPCACVEPRHKADVDCWISNPRLAPRDWQGVGPKNPNYPVYVAACQRDGVEVRGGAQGVVFPAAAAVFVRALADGCPVVAAVREAARTFTRAERRRLAGGVDGEAAAEPAVQVQMEVVLVLGRDWDLVEEVRRRAQAGRVDAPGVLAAAAAGVFSFGGDVARESQLQQAAQWAKGTVTARVTFWYPRDLDLVRELLERNALLRCHVQGLVQGRPSAEGEVIEVAAGVGAGQSPSCPTGQPGRSDVHQLHVGVTPGGLVYFANLTKAKGAVLVTPDGRDFLPHRLLVDSACQQGLMDQKYGLSMGMTAITVPGIELRTADGAVFAVNSCFPGVRIVLAQGTANEVSYKLDFWCIEGLGSLAQAIMPTMADHHFGGAGVDSVLLLYRYRPRWASHQDLSMAELPIIVRGPSSAVMVAAPATVVQSQGGVASTASAAEEMADPPAVLPRRAAPRRPRYSSLRHLVMLVCMLFFVVAFIGPVGAVPQRPRRGGTFRSHPV